MSKFLSREVEKQIKSETPNLLPSIWSKIDKFLNHWSGRTLIVLLTFIIFYTGHFINIKCLNFIHIEDESIKPMIESRTTNIVAIISISFAIVGFLISNLAVKGNKSYSILFRRSFFLPITFFSLTLICSFIILTALKDHFELETLARILYLGVFLMLVDIALIGFLFTRLILFTDSRTLYKMVCKDLQEECKGRILEYVIRNKSHEIVSQVLEASVPWGYYSRMPGGTEEIFIKDIALDKLQAIIKKYEGNSEIRIYHNYIYLNKNIQNDKIMFYCEKENVHLSAELESTVKLTHSINTISSETREYVKNELLKLIVANDYRSVEQILSEYSNIISIKYFEVVLLDEFINDLRELINKSIEMDSNESFKKIDEFISRILADALKKKDYMLYIRFLGVVYNNYVNASSDRKTNNKTAKFIRESSVCRISLMIEGTELYVVTQSDSEEIELLNRFAYWGYMYLGEILYSCISKNDIEGFLYNYKCLEKLKSGRVYDCYGDIPDDLEKFVTNDEKKDYLLKREISFYHLACIIGVKYWLYWLYYTDEMTPDKFAEYMQYIVIDTYSSIPLFWEMELLFSRMNTPRNYFNWLAWGNENDEGNAAHSLLSPDEWIIFGYAIDLVKMNGLPASGEVNLSLWGVNSKNRQIFIQKVKNGLDKVKQSIGKWRTLFNNQVITTDIAKEQLERIEKDMNEQQLKEIASADIDNAKVKKFIDQMHKKWLNEGIDETRFGVFDIIDFTEDIVKVEEELSKKTSLTIMAIDEKVFFIEGKNSVELNEHSFYSLISKMKEKFRSDLLRIIMRKKSSRIINKSWKNISNELKNNEVNKIIITDRFLAMELKKRFKDLDIRISNNSIIHDKIIIVDITRAFNIRMTQDSDGNQLRISILKITKEKAEALLKEQHDYWTKHGIYSDNEAIHYIMNSIEIKMELVWDFEIIDTSAYSIWKI